MVTLIAIISGKIDAYRECGVYVGTVSVDIVGIVCTAMIISDITVRIAS